MKHKVIELEGALLDAAVAKCEGHEYRMDTDGGDFLTCWLTKEAHYVEESYPQSSAFDPSTRWHHGGPIIERERITIVASEGYGDPIFWVAQCGAFSHYIDETLYGADDRNWQGAGPAPLIAAMRAYVASKFGEEVELP